MVSSVAAHDKWALEHNLLDISLDFFGSKRQLLLAEQVEGLHQNFYR